jgi:hypothetical protein
MTLTKKYDESVKGKCFIKVSASMKSVMEFDCISTSRGGHPVHSRGVDTLRWFGDQETDVLFEWLKRKYKYISKI